MPPRSSTEIIAQLRQFRSNGTVPCGSLLAELEQSIIAEKEGLERRIAVVERTLKRHQDFRQAAQEHVNNLINGESGSPGWRAAIQWWERINERVVHSVADGALPGAGGTA